MNDPRTPNDPLALTLTREDWMSIYLALSHSYDSPEMREVHQQIMQRIVGLMLVGAPEKVYEIGGIAAGQGG